MRQHNVVLFGLRFTVTRDADQFLLTPPRMEWPAEHQPQLRPGVRALHVSVPLRDRRDGVDPGVRRIHLKYDDGERRDIDAIRWADVQGFFKKLEDALMTFGADVIRRVELDELAQRGWFVLDDTNMRAVLAEVARAPKREYRIDNEAAISKLGDHVVRASPLDLESQRGECRQWMLAGPDGLMGSIQYLDFDTPRGPAGWYVLPIIPDLFQAILLPLFPVRCWRICFVAARELGAECNWRKLLDAAEGQLSK